MSYKIKICANHKQVNHKKGRYMLQVATEALDIWLEGWSTEAPTTYQRSDELAFQRWFHFKEAFSPILVRDIIKGMPNPPRNLVDCCAGSGTTGVVAQFSGIPCTLVEVNPFLVDLITAKTAKYDNINFANELASFDAIYSNTQIDFHDLRKRLPPTFVEPGVNDRWLFNKDIAEELERIRLSTIQIRDQQLRRFYLIALASILIHFSNVRIDGKGRRYRQGWEKRSLKGSDVYPQFKDSIYSMIRDIYAHDESKLSTCSVIHGDSREVVGCLDDEVDLFLFSPPYPNSFDYTDIYNVELWFLEYFKTAEDNIEQRKKTMRSHVQVRWNEPSYNIKSHSLRKTVMRLSEVREKLWDKRIPDMVQAYFEDMDILLSKMCARLSPHGNIAIVVGDSSYMDIWIESAKIITEIAKNNGLKVRKKKSERVMRASAQHTKKEKFLNEWLLIFEKL